MTDTFAPEQIATIHSEIDMPWQPQCIN